MTNTRAHLFLLTLLLLMGQTAADQKRPRARDIGLVVGVLPAGRFYAITDVEGVRVEALPIDKTIEILKKYNALTKGR